MKLADKCCGLEVVLRTYKQAVHVMFVPCMVKSRSIRRVLTATVLLSECVLNNIYNLT